MGVTDFVIWPRGRDLRRVDDPLSGWSQLKLVERWNVNSTWIISGPARVLDGVFPPGHGCIIEDEHGLRVTGRARTWHRAHSTRGDTVSDTATIGFVSDRARLGGRIVLPDHTVTIGTTYGRFPVSHYDRTAPEEDLILDLIRDQLGPAALADRRLAGIRVPVSQGRGAVRRLRGRFDNVGLVVQDLAEAASLRVEVLCVEDGTGDPWLDVVVTDVLDVSDAVRFGPTESSAMGELGDWSYTLEEPSATRVFALGGGEDAARNVLQVRRPEAEELFDVVAEIPLDQRQSDPLDDEHENTATFAELAALRDHLARFRTQADQAAVDEAQALRAQAFTSPPWYILSSRAARLHEHWDRTREWNDDVASTFSRLAGRVEKSSSEAMGEQVRGFADGWQYVRSADSQEREVHLRDAVAETNKTNPDFAQFIASLDAFVAAMAPAISVSSDVIDQMSTFIPQYGAAAAAAFDAREAQVNAELALAAQEALDDAAGVSTVTLAVVDGPDAAYRVDYDVGYRVGVDLPGLPDAAAENIVREVATTSTVSDGQATETRQVVIGTRDATGTQSVDRRRLVKMQQRVSRIEREF